MTIPKRRSYKLYPTIFAFVCVTISLVLVSFTSAFARESNIPEIFRSDRSTPQREREITQDQKNDTKHSTDTSQSSATATASAQSSTKTSQATNSTTVTKTTTPSVRTTAIPSSKSVVTPSVILPPAPQQAPQVVVPDTSSVSRQLVASQSVRTVLPSVYSSAKITTLERNEFYKTSLITAATGSGLYLLSFAGVAIRGVQRSFSPVRRTVIQ